MDKSTGFLDKKINTSSVVQRVIDSLTMAMINKELVPGDKIPTEFELSKSFGVGRLSIREAIKVLVYYGVLEIKRPEGTFVCKGFNHNLINPMLYGIILNDDDSYDSIKELRLIMEIGVIKLAAKKCTDADREILKQKLDNLKNALADVTNTEYIFEVDNDFHHFISEMGGNSIMDKINSLVRVLTYDIRYKTSYNMVTNGKIDRYFEAHEKIYHAIVNNDMMHIEEIVEDGYFY